MKDLVIQIPKYIKHDIGFDFIVMIILLIQIKNRKANGEIFPDIIYFYSCIFQTTCFYFASIDNIFNIFLII